MYIPIHFGYSQNSAIRARSGPVPVGERINLALKTDERNAI